MSQISPRALESGRGWDPKSIVLMEGARSLLGTFVKIDLAQQLETHLCSLKPLLSLRSMLFLSNNLKIRQKVTSQPNIHIAIIFNRI